jgi:hypothetical protein
MARPKRPDRVPGAALVACAALVAFRAGAEESPGSTPPAVRWVEAIELRGFVSASFGHSFARPASGTNQLRAFDVDDGSIRLDVAALVVEKPAEEPGEAGLRLDALAGSSLPRATAADGLFRDPETGEAGDFDLLQAYVRWVAPVGGGLRLDAGKFVTSFGVEPIEGPDGWGDHATHSFLFTLSEPTTHTGLRASYAFSDRFSAELLLVNGWDDAKDRNGAKSFGAGVTIVPGGGATLTATVMTGPERAGDSSSRRTLVGLAAEISPRGAVAGGVNFERGEEEGLGEEGATVSWWGVAAYARWAPTRSLALALRAERFEDPDGARSGTAQALHALTLTPALTLAPGLVVRADLRLDLSDEPVFEDADGLFTRKSQPTVLLNALYAF